MVDRASVNESAQWGIETTPGVAVEADRRIRSMSVKLGVEGENDLFRPDGQKFASVVAPNMEWTSLAIDGKPSYTEICIPLSSIAGAPVESAAGGGVQRVYTIKTSEADDAQTLSIEKGSAVRASRITYGLISELGLTFSRRNGVNLSGSGIGQLLVDGITKTPAPTSMPLVPIVGKELDFFIDGLAADLGETKMLRAFSVEPQVSNKYGPIWAIDSDEASFGGHVELVPSGTCRIRLEADAAGMAYLAEYRSGDLLFARILATGRDFEVGHHYSYQQDMALGIRRVTNFGEDEEGVTVLDYETEFVDDEEWGKAVEITVINDIDELSTSEALGS